MVIKGILEHITTSTVNLVNADLLAKTRGLRIIESTVPAEGRSVFFFAALASTVLFRCCPAGSQCSDVDIKLLMAVPLLYCSACFAMHSLLAVCI